VICINILDFKLFGREDKYHLCFMLRELEDPKLILTEHLVIHYLELPEFTDYSTDRVLDKWLYYLKHEGREEEDARMKTLLEENPRLAEAHEKYTAFTRDDELRDAYEARMKWKMDYLSSIVAARQEGREEGFDDGHEKGRAEEKFQTIMKLRRFEMKSPEIAEITGLTPEKVEAIPAAGEKGKDLIN